MSFKPSMVAAIREKQRQGILPKNPMNPQNVIHQIPNLVPSSPIPSPVANATMPQFRPSTPAMPMPHAPGTAMPSPGASGPMKRFAGLRKKLGGL